VVLFYWAAVGIAVGVLTHLLLRIRGEEGYQIVGETLLGCVGAMTTGMILGVIFGWRTIGLESGLSALIGAVISASLVIYFTLAASPRQHNEMQPPPAARQP
jgi:uncharacterized membrane protein YeaQ/YmgE (transglycosylase-associated protein family)